MTLGVSYDRLFPVMRDRDREWKTVKVKGPWMKGVETVREISLDEWTSYTPLNKRVRGAWFRVVNVEPDSGEDKC